MSKGKLERIVQKNLLMENRYLSKKNMLLEYDEKVVESKKNEIVSTLQSLKSAQKGMLAGIKKSEIDKQISEVQSISTKNVCNGTVLNQEIASKLIKAENTLNEYDSQLDDCPEGCKSKLRANITFIKEFCTKEGTQNQTKPNVNQDTKNLENTKTKDNKEEPIPSGDQYAKSLINNPQSSNTDNVLQPQQNILRVTSNPSQNTNQPNQPTNIPDSERKPRFMDELDRLNTDQRFTKQDIIDYVKSRVKVRTA